MHFLAAEQLSHYYFSPKMVTCALDNITFRMKEGEFLSLLGPSGCGKTTLLSILAGLIDPTSGRVEIEGVPPGGLSNSIGYMLQQDYLFPWKTIEENILLGLKLGARDSESEKRKALELLGRIGLEGVEKQFPRQLSGGMRQRAALARTLAVDPKILLLDEPFSALDYQTKLNLEDLVFETLKAYNKTAILVTHDIGEAISMSDRILLLAARPGRVHKIFDVPDDLRSAMPFDVRSKDSYHTLFQQIWKEMEMLEQE